MTGTPEMFPTRTGALFTVTGIRIPLDSDERTSQLQGPGDLQILSSEKSQIRA